MTATTKPRIAVVGCGPWGQNLAMAFAKEDVLRVLVDVDHSRAEELATSLYDQGYGKSSVCSWEEVLADVSIDAVALATPASMHADMATATLAASKHVYIEKPFALSVSDGKRVMDAAAKWNKLVMVGHLFQYHSAFVKLKAMVLQGKLGRIRHIHSRRFGFGRIRQQEDVFWNLGSHDISMILGLAGEMPVTVSAKGFHHLRTHVADIATAELSFASGLQAQVLVSWLFPEKERKLIVVGDIATAVFDDCEPWATKLRIFRNSVKWDGDIPEAVCEGSEALILQIRQPLAIECQHFIECVQSGRQPATNSEEAQRVVEVLTWIEHQIQQNGSEIASDHGDSKSKNSSSRLSLHNGRQSYTKLHPAIQETKHHVTQGLIPIDTDAAIQKSPNGKLPATTHQIPLIDLTTQRLKVQDQSNLRLGRVFEHSKSESWKPSCASTLGLSTLSLAEVGQLHLHLLCSP